jgi:hypothetical protein
MRIWATLVLFACQSAPAAAPAPPAPEKSCLDREIEKRGLNEYGDAKGTMYPGGTPLFHENTGKMTAREDYIREKHPEIASACKAP